MGADDLDEGTFVQITHPDHGAMSGSIHRVHSSDNTFDYTVDLDDDLGYIDARQEWITNFDGRGADALDVQEGRVVYVAQTDSFGVIVQSSIDPDTDDVTGAYVDFTRDGSYDDLFSLHEFEVVPDDGSILTDSNGLYVPSVNYRGYDITEEFETLTTYPGQRLVVFDTFDKKYRRATLLSYPEEDNDRLRVQFDDDGNITEIGTSNASGFRLAGGEFWDSLTTPEKKDRLRAHFDETVKVGHTRGYLSGYRNLFNDPDDNRIDWVRDTWIDELWDSYRDDWYIKESIRNLETVFTTDKSRRDSGVLGGIGTNTERSGYVAHFWSMNEVSSHSRLTEDYYKGTLRHESFHAATQSNRYSRTDQVYEWETVLDNVDWGPNGKNSNVQTDLPDSALGSMFTDVKTGNSNNAHPVGGTDWLEDAFYAANGGSQGIRNFEPDFGTPEESRFERLLEAGNLAYWLQTVSASRRYQRGNFDPKDPIFTERPYSSLNAEETLATMHELLTSNRYDTDDLDDRLRYLVLHYPWLVEAWLEMFNPGTKQRQILNQLGVDV
jgi:hypothetical protein